MSDETRLLGTKNDNWVNGNGGWFNNTNNAILSQWTTEKAGQVAYIWVKVSKAGEVNVAIYTDNNGVPGARLGHSAKQAVKPGWNSIWLISRVDVLMNRSYWIGFIGNVDTGMFYYGPPTGNINICRPAAYASWSWPSQAGTGWTPPDSYEYATKALGFPASLFLGAWGDVNPSLDGGQNYVILSKQQASVSSATNEGLIYGILVHVSQPGMAKVALYADSNGQPGSLLSSANTEQPVSIGWNLIKLPGVKVINLKDYWIGFYGSVTSGMYCYSYLQGTGCHARWKLDTYSPNWQWPDPAGPGWTEQLDYSYSNGALGFPIVKLLGTNSDSFQSSDAKWAFLELFKADDSGVVTEIRVKVQQAGAVKVAIYHHAKGWPDALPLLSAVNDEQPVNTGWNAIVLPKPVTVIGGNAYYLGLCSNTPIYCSSGAGVNFYKPATFTAWTWTDPAGTGWTYDPNSASIIGYAVRACGIAGLTGIETFATVAADLLNPPASTPPPIRTPRRQRKPNTRVRKPRQP
jgi:hypothetical protein